MSPLARGVYRELLDAAWLEEGCSLPNDDRTLARLADVRLSLWRRVKAEVLAAFEVGEDGRLRQKRLTWAWEKGASLRERRRRAADETNLKRYGQRDGDRVGERDAERDGKRSPPSPSPSPSPYEVTTEIPVGLEAVVPTGADTASEQPAGQPPTQGGYTHPPADPGPAPTVRPRAGEIVLPPNSAAGPPNALVDRDRLIREGHEAIRIVSAAKGEDPTETLARCSTGGGRYTGSPKVRLDTMRDDRLALTVADLRRERREVEGVPEPSPPPRAAREPTAVERTIASTKAVIERARRQREASEGGGDQ